MAKPGGSHPGAIGGEQAAKQSNLGGGNVGGSGPKRSAPTRNPLKYEKKKTKVFDASWENLAKVGTIIGGAVVPGVGPALTAASAALGEDVMNPFGKPIGEADSYTYDKSEKVPPAATVKPKTTKKKATNPLAGLVGTLLDGAGGRLSLA